MNKHVARVFKNPKKFFEILTLKILKKVKYNRIYLKYKFIRCGISEPDKFERILIKDDAIIVFYENVVYKFFLKIMDDQNLKENYFKIPFNLQNIIAPYSICACNPLILKMDRYYTNISFEESIDIADYLLNKIYDLEKTKIYNWRNLDEIVIGLEAIKAQDKLNRFFDGIIEKIDDFFLQGVDVGIVFGDFHIDNIVLDFSLQPLLIDFDSVSNNFKAFDLIQFMVINDVDIWYSQIHNLYVDPIEREKYRKLIYKYIVGKQQNFEMLLFLWAIQRFGKDSKTAFDICEYVPLFEKIIIDFLEFSNKTILR